MAFSHRLVNLLSLIMMLSALCCKASERGHNEEGLELLFHQRSQSDWEDVWHRETHSRCRDKIIRQLYWACEKDIYRLSRRNRKRTMDPNALTAKDDEKRQLPTKWWRFGVTNSLLRFRRNTNSQTITSECCTKVGCTWEEYAEYCPSNKRRNHY